MKDLRGKRVLVVGLARSGQAAAHCLRHRGALVTVTDTKPPSVFQDVIPELLAQKVGLELGLHRDETFLQQDLIVVSPGVPWDLPQLQLAREKRIPVMPEIDVARWFLAGRIVGITGTNGKTTTTALLGRVLEASGFSTFVGGNIGVPLTSLVDQVTPDSVVVAELSSFQLEATQHFRPHVAVLLNITPNHLDRHSSFEAYVRAKAQIFSNQKAEDCAVLNADDPNVMGLVPALDGRRKIFFSRQQSLPGGVFVSNGKVRYRVAHLERVLLETREVPLRGDFNVENVLAACAAACVLGTDFEALRRTVCEFKGVEHRLEFVRQIRGVDFYNDSKATSVDATLKALSAFERGVHLIMGGMDKKAPYRPLRPLLADRVRTVFLIGAAAERIARELAGAAELVRAGELEVAVREAFRRGVPGDTVLLSPACASFDQFQDFEHRGRVFKEIVAALARETVVAGEHRPEESSHQQMNVGSDTPVQAETRREQPMAGPAENGSTQQAGQNDQPVPDSEATTREPESVTTMPTSTPLQPIVFYEVGGEEILAGDKLEVPPDAVANAALIEILRPLGAPEDEPLLFEVRLATPNAYTPDLILSRPGATRAAAGGTGGNSMRADSKSQLQQGREHGPTT